MTGGVSDAQQQTAPTRNTNYFTYHVVMSRWVNNVWLITCSTA